MIKTDAYLKQDPVLDALDNLKGGHTEGLDRKVYKFSLGPGKKSFAVYRDENPMRYSHDHEYRATSIDAITEVSRRGVQIPESLTQKARREGRFLIADEELYQILKESPRIEEALKNWQPLWGITKFGEGSPLYAVTLVGSMLATQEVIEAMIGFSKFLAIRYNGIVWNQTTGRFGRPTAVARSQFDSVDYGSFNPRAVGWRWSSRFE